MMLGRSLYVLTIEVKTEAEFRLYSRKVRITLFCTNELFLGRNSVHHGIKWLIDDYDF